MQVSQSMIDRFNTKMYDHKNLEEKEGEFFEEVCSIY